VLEVYRQLEQLAMLLSVLSHRVCHGVVCSCARRCWRCTGSCGDCSWSLTVDVTTGHLRLLTSLTCMLASC